VKEISCADTSVVKKLVRSASKKRYEVFIILLWDDAGFLRILIFVC